LCQSTIGTLAEQVVVESAPVDIWPCLDAALCDDGRRSEAWCGVRVVGWHGRALGSFLVQWLLNALWTPLFFGLHHPNLAFAEITAL